MPKRSFSKLFAPSLLALLVFGAQAAYAQTAAAEVSAARLSTSDFGHLLKPAAEDEAGAAKAEAAAPTAEARPAPRPEFGRDERAAARIFPQTTQDPSAQPTPSATPYVPLTGEEKMSRAFKSAFLSPQGYALSAFRATLTQAGEDELPDKEFEDEFGDWAARFGRNVANRATRTLFASGIYPALFKQDPRYERAPKDKGFMYRTGHAVSRVFVTRGDNGNIQPNFSRFAGVVTAAGLVNIWERSTPGHDRVGADATVRRIARSFPNDMLYNVIREFLPDVIGIFRK
jgi:hypothetical protein